MSRTLRARLPAGLLIGLIAAQATADKNTIPPTKTAATATAPSMSQKLLLANPRL